MQGDRPRQVDQQQEDKAIKLSAHLVTILATVSDSAGNLVNDISRDEFEIFEDNVAQQISGLYREEQMPLRMVFLFDTSTSIRQRFDFDFTPVFKSIAEEIRSSYVVAYYPPDKTRHDGRVHQIRVEVNRSGAIVRASRTSYQALR